MSNTTSPRLVALDLDGTLLNHQGQVTPHTRQAIAEAVARGIVVLPATGRPLSNLPPVVAQLTGIRYAITSNGAAVWDLGTDPMSAVYSRYCNAGLPHRAAHAGGAGAGGLCTLYGIPRRDEHLLRWPHLP